MNIDIKDISGRIDRNAPEPYYMQLLRLIEAQIRRGGYRAGARLPGETDLCQHFGLARSTVRETLRSLQDRGLIKIVPRRGAYLVTPPPTGWLLQVSEGFFEGQLYREHGSVETRVLRSEIQPASDEMCSILELSTSKTVYVLERLRLLEGKVAIYSINYLLPELKPRIEATDVVRGEGSLNGVLNKEGYAIHGAHREVEAVSADDELADKLNVAVGSPLLLVTSKSWNENNQPFDYYRSWLRSDVVKVSVIAKATCLK